MDNFGFVPTNTMASTPFDVLKMDAVEDPLINVNKLATMDLEESYATLALDFIKESNKEITNCKLSLYRSISESTSHEVILESYTDFFTKIKEIINKFLKFIKSLFQKFITALMKMVNSDKYIIKHKDDFSKFKDVDEFNISGYEYTFKPNVPAANAVISFNNNLFDELYNSSAHGLDIESVKASTSTLSNKLEDDYDRFRASVLNRNEEERIYLNDFGEELFKEFRNDELDTSSITVDAAKVRESLNRFIDYKKIKSNIESDQKNIERAYEAVKKDVQEITKRNKDLNVQAFLNKLPDGHGINSIEGNSVTNAGLTMSAEMMTYLDMYVKAKTDQITEYSNIHVLAFSYKLDALKQCYIQDRNMLYTALQKVQRTDSKRGV